MPIDPGSLRRSNPPEVEQADFPCPQCGYNLKGLKRSDACPECGCTTRRSMSWQLTSCEAPELPVRHLRRLAWGARIMAPVALVMPAGMLWAEYEVPSWAKVVANAVAVLLALGWALGVGLITVTPHLRKREIALTPPAWWANLRPMARLAAAFLLGYAFVGLLQSLRPFPGPTLEWTGYVLGILAGLGMVPLLCLLTLFAEGGRDDDLATRLRACMWLVPIVVLLHVLPPLGTSLLTTTGWNVRMFIGLIGIPVVLCHGLFCLGSIFSWAALHREQDMERRERLRAREQSALRGEALPAQSTSRARTPRARR